MSEREFITVRFEKDNFEIILRDNILNTKLGKTFPQIQFK